MIDHAGRSAARRSNIAAGSTTARCCSTARPATSTTRCRRTIYSKGQFNLNDTWRWGFNVARASSADYVRDFHLGGQLGSDPNLLTSQIYVEGFGQGAYSRFDVRVYQALNNVDHQQQAAAGPAALPVQLFRPARCAGRPAQRRCRRVQRDAHRRHQHAACQSDGELVAAVRRRARRSVEDHAAQRRDRLRRQRLQRAAELRPARARSTRRAPCRRRRLDFRWPFMRDSGAWGTQLIEPIAQIVVAPQVGDSQRQQVSERGQPRPRILRRQPVRLQPLSRRSTGWTAACGRTSRCTAPGILAAPRSTG